ncbi:hypothetical protein [Silvibacterium acidisoli]|uniref:hypothetical protein n=1 Tax=Acidobacteriaceae bacterium ZG23-2 TaxID=2883246 RepID=UPI00406CF60A
MAESEFLRQHSQRLKIAGLLLVFAPFCIAAAQSAPGEKTETGQGTTGNGQPVSYTIRLLPLASFPELPATVAAVLQTKNCLVPQTFEAHAPENVIPGAFEKEGSQDWAALCSADGVTTLYVVFGSHPATPVALRSQPDAKWLGSEQAGVYGAAWGISRRPGDQLRPARMQVQGGGSVHSYDHDGIEDAFVEKNSTVHYFEAGQWLVLESGQ